jgi:hypothetical protein
VILKLKKLLYLYNEFQIEMTATYDQSIISMMQKKYNACVITQSYNLNLKENHCSIKDSKNIIVLILLFKPYKILKKFIHKKFH